MGEQMNAWLSLVALDYDFGARPRHCECSEQEDPLDAASLTLLACGLTDRQRALLVISACEPDRKGGL